MNRVYEASDRIERPSRYIGGEINSVTKDESQVALKMALAFPDVYEIGMSHVGLKILYNLINSRPEFWAERVMAPWPDQEAVLRASGRGLRSLESGRLLADFDLIGFSLQYELTYTNVLTMLELGGLEMTARDRGAEAPLVVGGGPNACNPEPVADFFDFFYLGDAEAGWLDVLDVIASWRRARGTKAELLAALAGRPGIYAPMFFQPVYESGRVLEIKPLRIDHPTVVQAVSPDLNRADYPTCPVVPFTKPVHDRVALEIARGCTRGCRFCQAGFIYRPVRERRPEVILDLAARSLKATGYEEASFLSLSAGDYTRLPELMTAFMDAHGPRHVALALPSLRVKSLTPDMMDQIKRVRKTGFTLAPEAGTQRLRQVINKDLTEEDLFYAAGEAFRAGWRLIKLYFMIGLPTETDEDVQAIADLARRLAAGIKGRVNVSFATFVPKPHTPFQWEAMLSYPEMGRRMEMLRTALRRPKLKPKWNEKDSSLLEGILSRGDRRLAPVIRRVQSLGGRFDAWGDRLQPELWRQALSEAGLSPEAYLKERGPAEVLPWSHLQTGPAPSYLWAEREKAYQGRTTPDCRFGDCQKCGACDFQEIKPRLCPPDSELPKTPSLELEAGETRIRVNYAKEGPARVLSHLETMDVFLRAFRRAGLVFKMSQGYHPQPRLSFTTALPVGLASRDEYLEAVLLAPPSTHTVKDLLRCMLPPGFTVLEVTRAGPGTGKLKARGARYRIEAPGEIFSQKDLQDSIGRDKIPVVKSDKKGRREVDLKPLLGPLNVLTSKVIEFTLYFGPEGSVRPLPAAVALFNPDIEKIAGAEVIKLKTILED